MTLTTSAPPLSTSTPLPKRLALQLALDALDLVGDMQLAFVFDVKLCQVIFECPHHL